MLAVRRSPDTAANPSLTSAPARRGESNREWLARVGIEDGIVLLGGSSVEHFRIRVAQSHARSDLLPSFWSLAGILGDAQTFLSVPLEFRSDGPSIPANNAIQACSWDDYDDPRRFPNIAALRFTADQEPIRGGVERVRTQRSVVDLPALVVAWLGFAWGVAQTGNPLLDGKGLPSAVFVGTAYAIAGVELTPGLASASACPEVIWQAAKWWRRFYEATAAPGDEAHARGQIPSGSFATRQRAAAVVELK